MCYDMTPELKETFTLCQYDGDEDTGRRLLGYGLDLHVLTSSLAGAPRLLLQTGDVGRGLAESGLSVVPMHALAFRSILEAAWWCCVTMTTVGYGDVSPVNWVSRLVAAATMLSGIMLIALPVAI